MNIIYRELKVADYPIVKNLINKSFGLHRYVDNQSILESWLNVYLQSCLAEKTFDCVAEKDGKVIGIIMGQAKSDYRFPVHLKPNLKMAYHSAVMILKSQLQKCDISANKRINQIYHELLTECRQNFDGVLTLFAVTEDCRGLGVGKELLNRLLAYQKKSNTKNIYLYTDSTCNYGFYESQGFRRLGEKNMQIMRNHQQDTMEVYLYGYRLTE